MELVGRAESELGSSVIGSDSCIVGTVLGGRFAEGISELGGAGGGGLWFPACNGGDGEAVAPPVAVILVVVGLVAMLTNVPTLGSVLMECEMLLAT